MNNKNFKFYVVCAVLILGFLAFLGYFEIIGEEKAVAQIGDEVRIDYTYTDLEGEEQETSTTYLVGSEDMTKTFDDALVGVKKNDEKTIEVTYPEDWTIEDYQNETFSYEVTVNKVLKCTGSQEACLAQ